jgi:arsenite methyltransferase
MEFTEPVLLELESQRRSVTSVTKRDRVMELLQPVPGERILDIGCGGGAFCRQIAPLVAPGGSVVGIDNAQAAVDVALRLSALEDRSLLTFMQADGHDLPFADASFDAAVCISVLGFCQDPRQVLAEARRVLRPGGRFLVVNSDEDTRVYNGRDRDLGRRIARAIADRSLDPWLGRRLAPMLTAAGFHLKQEKLLVDLEREFAAGTSGYALAHFVRDYLLQTAGIPPVDYERWLADLAACAVDGSYCYSVVTYACLATR